MNDDEAIRRQFVEQGLGDDQTWIGGIGCRAAFTVLDQLAAHLGVAS